MTATAPATKSLIVTGLMILALATSAGVMLAAPKVAQAGATNSDLEDVPAVSTDVSEPGEASPAGTTIAHGGWEVTVEEAEWGQNEAVWEATRFPDTVLLGDVHEWVTAPLTVTNTSDEVASFRYVDVTMNGHSYRWHHSLPERQSLPDEFEFGLFEPGEARTGTIGWIRLSASVDRDCGYEVVFDDRSYALTCDAAP